MTLIERAARRVCALEAGLPLDPADQRGPAQTWIDVNWRACVPKVREVLVEARAPSQDMRLAGSEARTPDGFLIGQEDADEVWEAMIGMALAEE